MQNRKSITVVIPTWNERGNVKRVIDGVSNLLRKYGYRYEVIVVDRHSEDGTAAVARAKGAKILYDNRGKGAALIKGFAAARGQIIISMDADLSNRPNELLLLIAGIETGYDICVGSRFLTGGGSEDMPWYRIFGNKFFVVLVNMIYGSNYSDMCYGYRSFSRYALGKIHLKESGFGIETEINIKAKKAGLKVLEVPSFEKLRTSGRGKLRSFRDGYIILKTIIKNIEL